MTPVDYLLTSFVAFVAMASWTLFTAARYAVDGFEDEFGFHLGVAPPITSLGLSAYSPAELVRAAVPAAPKRRRKRGSKPPMLPANLNVDDLHSGPAAKSQAGKATDAETSRSGQAQLPLRSDQPPGV